MTPSAEARELLEAEIAQLRASARGRRVLVDYLEWSADLLEKALAGELTDTPIGCPSESQRLFAYLKHGDAAHQAWLKSAIEAFFAGDPRPDADKGPTDAESELDTYIEP